MTDENSYLCPIRLKISVFETLGSHIIRGENLSIEYSDSKLAD